MQRKIAVYMIIFLAVILLNIYYHRQYLIEQWMKYNLSGEYIVVSLSTTPYRINDLQPTINSLLAQNAPIKKIYLNIPYVFKRDNLEYAIPEWLLNQKQITILRTEDYGPATKLLGTLANTNLPGNAIIITIDDDVIYPSNLVLQLAYKAKMHPDRAIGIVGAVIDVNADLGLRKIKTSDALVNILQGYAGVAYRRNFFDDSIFAITSAPKECINSDDVYLSFFLAKHGIQRQVLRNSYINACDIRWETEIGTDLNSLHNLLPKPADKHQMCMTYLQQIDPQVHF